MTPLELETLANEVWNKLVWDGTEDDTDKVVAAILAALTRVQDESLNNVFPNEETIQNIVRGIWLDCFDRRGIKREFEQTDYEVQQEIWEQWEQIVKTQLSADMSKKPQNIDTKTESVDTSDMKPAPQMPSEEASEKELAGYINSAPFNYEDNPLISMAWSTCYNWVKAHLRNGEAQ